MDEFKSMKFFDGYFNAIMKLPDDKTKVEVFEAVIRYGLTGEEPSCTGFAAAQFEAFRVSLDSNRQAHKRNIENGRKLWSCHTFGREAGTASSGCGHGTDRKIRLRSGRTGGGLP